MIDCAELIERKVFRKVMNRKKRVRRGEDKKERKKYVRGNFSYSSLHAILPVHTRTTAALECGHLPRQVWPLNCHFQHDALCRMGRHVNLIYGP